MVAFPQDYSKPIEKPKQLERLGLLLPYQLKWVGDNSRFKIGLWARQCGKSFATVAESVIDCHARKTKWVILSVGERQALEWMAKAKSICKAFGIALKRYHEDRESYESVLTQSKITFPNGSEIIAIPANPDTARGYTANLVLDEFAYHERPNEIWRAIYPSITNQFAGQLKLRIVSTPNGIGNKFYDLWHRNDQYSKHKVDIYQAQQDGLPVNVEELRAGLDDPEGWAQDYLCEFLDSSAVLLPYETIAACESHSCLEACDPNYWADNSDTNLVLGIDFARSQHLSVCWASEVVGDISMTREVLEMQCMSTPSQVEMLRPRINKATRVCLDYTGPGVGLGDYLVEEFGEYNPDKHLYGKVELMTFTNASKVELFSKLRMAFESRNVRIPVSRKIREDLHSVHRVSLTGGGVTYRAPFTKDSHADRCTALALCNRAANQIGRFAAYTAEVV